MPNIPVPLHCVVEFDELSKLTVEDLQKYEDWAMTERDLFQATYSNELTLDIAWRRVKSADDDGPYEYSGLIVSIARGTDRMVPIVSWIALDFDQLWLALRLVDEWCVAQSGGTTRTG